MGDLSLLQRIFPTQESNWGLLHCRWILYELSYEGSPIPCSPIIHKVDVAMELPCQPSIYIWTYKRKIDCSFVFMSIFLVIFCNLKIYSQFWKYLGTEST